MKKIIFITRNMSAGGAERVIAQLADYFSHQPINCKILTLEDTHDWYNLPENTGRISIGKQSDNKLLNKLKTYGTIRKIIKKEAPDTVLSMPEEVGVYVILALLGTGIRVIVSERNNPRVMPDVKITRILHSYDVVHIHRNSSTMAIEVVCAKLCGVHNIIVHGHSTQCDHVLANRILKPVMMGLSDCHLSCSEEAGNWLYGTGNYTVLNNAIHLDRYVFDPEIRKNVRKEWNIQEHTQVLGHVGKIYAPKNHRFLVDIFSEYHKVKPDSKLVLVGDGDLRPELEQQIHSLGLTQDVIFMGMRTDTEKWLQGMDCFVFPSYYEGFGLALVEAQASGIKCFASSQVPAQTNVLGNVEYLSLEDGAESWADCLYSCDWTRADKDEVKIRFEAAHLDISEEGDKLRRIYLNS